MVFPAATSTTFSPLMVSVTAPLGDSLALANNKSDTKSITIIKNTATAAKIVVVIIRLIYFTFL